MARLDFSFDCRVFAFDFRVGSKPCTCNTHPPTQKAPSARHNGDNDATQVRDPILLTTSGLLDSETEKTLGLPTAKSRLDSVIDPLLLKSSRLSDATNERVQRLIPSKNLSESRVVINPGEYLCTKPSENPTESRANGCAHKDTGHSSNDSV